MMLYKRYIYYENNKVKIRSSQLYCLPYRRPYLLRHSIEFLYTKYILFIKRSQNCINLMPYKTWTCPWTYLLFSISGLNDSRQNNKNCKVSEAGRKSRKGIVTRGDSGQDKEAKWQGWDPGGPFGKNIGLEQVLVKYFVILSEMGRHWKVLRIGELWTGWHCNRITVTDI